MSNSDQQLDTPTTKTVTWSEAIRFWAWLGCVSFGGPAGQISIMHQEVVERKRWVSERQFQHALNYCMMLPGPEAQQLATYLGWLLHGNWGGVIAGSLFILPGFFLLMLLSWVSLAFGEVLWVRAILEGFQPAVIAVIFVAILRIASKNLRTPIAWMLAFGSLTALLLGVNFAWILLVSAVVGIAFRLQNTHAGHADDEQFLRSAHADRSATSLMWYSLLMTVLFLCIGGGTYLALHTTLGTENFLTHMARFFTYAAFLTFGGAYAVLPFVGDYAEQQQWVDHGQLLTGLALGETTPGPLILVITYLAFVGGWRNCSHSPTWSGIAGGTVATWFTFLPSFAFILIGAPWVERLRSVSWLNSALQGITSAVVGVIAHLALTLTLHIAWPKLPKLSSMMEFLRHGNGPDGWASAWREPNYGHVAMAVIVLILLQKKKLSVPWAVLLCGAWGLIKWLLIG
jgi:chromate transporter